jgi:hypothetical protein
MKESGADSFTRTCTKITFAYNSNGMSLALVPDAKLIRDAPALCALVAPAIFFTPACRARLACCAASGEAQAIKVRMATRMRVAVFA